MIHRAVSHMCAYWSFWCDTPSGGELQKPLRPESTGRTKTTDQICTTSTSPPQSQKPAVRMRTALLSTALLLMLLPAVPSQSSNQTPITVVVTNSVSNPPNQTYSTHVVFRGILLGGLRRLQESDANFTFTYTEDPNYGPFLQSVNGLPGSSENSTYWELLVNKANNQTVRPDVGIGCYIPSADDQIILNYNRFVQSSASGNHDGNIINSLARKIRSPRAQQCFSPGC